MPNQEQEALKPFESGTENEFVHSLSVEQRKIFYVLNKAKHDEVVKWMARGAGWCAEIKRQAGLLKTRATPPPPTNAEWEQRVRECVLSYAEGLNKLLGEMRMNDESSQMIAQVYVRATSDAANRLNGFPPQQPSPAMDVEQIADKYADLIYNAPLPHPDHVFACVKEAIQVALKQQSSAPAMDGKEERAMLQVIDERDEAEQGMI